MHEFPDKSRWLQRFEKPAPSTQADSFTRIRWLRERLRPYARDLAAWEYCGIEFSDLDTSPHAEAEILLAAVQTAESHALPRDEAIVAARAEYRDGKERAKKFADDLRRTIWRLGRERAPGTQILAEAQAVNDRHGCALPTDLLKDAARRIAYAAAEGIRHVRR